MSDTPRTDAEVFLTIGKGFNAVCPNFARKLERETSALKADFKDEVKRHNADVKTASQEIASLKMKLELSMREKLALRAELEAAQAFHRVAIADRENAALRERIEMLSKLNTKQTDEYVCVDREHGLWKRNEAQSCPHCTNGIVRSSGRDNDEVIDDCPHCSREQRKEAKP